MLKSTHSLKKSEGIDRSQKELILFLWLCCSSSGCVIVLVQANIAAKQQRKGMEKGKTQEGQALHSQPVTLPIFATMLKRSRRCQHVTLPIICVK
jgi:hypothetical protein